MKVIFYNYFQALFHPIKFHKYLREDREKVKNHSGYGQKLRIANDGEGDPKVLGKMFRLNFFESLSISWGFTILQALYSYLGLWLGKYLMNYLGWGAGGGFSGKKYILIYEIGSVVIFPVLTLVYVKIWSYLIVFFGILYDKEEESSEVANDIMTTSLSTYAFLAIPIMGEFIQKLSFIFYIFVGLKENMKLGNLQSFLVIISPILLFLAFIIFFTSLFVGFIQSF